MPGVDRVIRENIDTINELPEWLSRTEIAHLLGVTSTTIKRWAKAGMITERAIRVNCVEVNVQSVLRYRFPNAGDTFAWLRKAWEFKQ
jgi:hypothetical protein